MLSFALRVQTNRKLTVVNKMTRNLLLRQPKGIDYQVSKEKASNIDKRITKQTLSTFANRNDFLVNPLDYIYV